MDNKKYVLTDGIKYIKINSQDDPTKTGDIALANVFNSRLDANNYLQSQKMRSINRNNGKNLFRMEELEGLPNFIKTPEEKEFDKNMEKELQELDDSMKDFEYFKFSDENNRHIYSKTTLEEDGFDFPEFMKKVIEVFSQLDMYNENMAYKEREMDLNICDYRHFKRDPLTKMNAIEAQKLQYIEQEDERKRIEYKRNKMISSIILKDLNRLKNSSYIKIIDNICNSEYKYRRINKDKINEMISTKRCSSKLKQVI